jgi:hypothetical protein
MMGVGVMTPLKTVFISLALTAATMGASASAFADTATADPTQVSTLVGDIETAINALPAGSSVLTIEGAINGAIAKDGFSANVTAAALQVVETSEASGSNASVAVASLEPATGGSNIQAGGQGGGSPIGSPVAGSSSGSGYGH